LHSLGLVEPRNSRTILKFPTEEPKIIPNPQSMTVFRSLPFTHLPESFRLRNNSFYPSLRAETHNKDLIDINWRKVDNLCPAYPEGHRRHVNYAITRPVVEHSKTKTGKIS
jgi:hypothetical protein